MSKTTLAVKVDAGLLKQVRRFCEEHGLKQGFLVEKALREQLGQEELLEDLLDFKRLRPTEKEALSYEEYLKARGA